MFPHFGGSYPWNLDKYHTYQLRSIETKVATTCPLTMELTVVHMSVLQSLRLLVCLPREVLYYVTICFVVDSDTTWMVPFVPAWGHRQHDFHHLRFFPACSMTLNYSCTLRKGVVRQNDCSDCMCVQSIKPLTIYSRGYNKIYLLDFFKVSPASSSSRTRTLTTLLTEMRKKEVLRRWGREYQNIRRIATAGVDSGFEHRWSPVQTVWSSSHFAFDVIGSFSPRFFLAKRQNARLFSILIPCNQLKKRNKNINWRLLHVILPQNIDLLPSFLVV